LPVNGCPEVARANTRNANTGDPWHQTKLSSIT
jgi:hypothetical protein